LIQLHFNSKVRPPATQAGAARAASSNKPAGQDPGSIGAMRDDAEFLDRIVEDAMRDRRD
jgi:hypothetical protein